MDGDTVLTIIKDEDVEGQMDFIKEAYRPHNITFQLLGTTRSQNKTWAVYDPEKGSAPQEMKVVLRDGTYAALNLYVVDTLAPSQAGYCSYPREKAAVETGSVGFYQDGCVIVKDVFYNGANQGMNGGGTAVHEVRRLTDDPS